jgi:hypothetical protein
VYFYDDAGNLWFFGDGRLVLIGWGVEHKCATRRDAMAWLQREGCLKHARLSSETQIARRHTIIAAIGTMWEKQS